MRVSWRRRGGEERGAVAVLVAVSMTAVLGGAAISVDLGNTWQEQRQLHTAADAAALSAGEAYAFDGDGCSSIAGAYLDGNDAASSESFCEQANGGAPYAGYVTVGATKPVDWHFAEEDEGDVVSQTSAEWGLPSAAGGMRPFALCEHFPAFATWLEEPDVTSDVIQVPFTKGSLGCDNSPGNWTFLDYDNTGGGADDLKDWFENGYPEPVEFPSNIAPQTGHVSSLASTLQALIDDGTVFPIAVYDLVTGTGNNASYHAVGVVRVSLVAFRITGPQDGQHMTFRFEPGFVEGRCCGTGPDTGARVVTICAVNKDPEEGQCGE
jgi:hypothetical protein